MTPQTCCFALVVVFTAALWGACGPGFNSASGDDVQRRGALPLATDVPGDDRVSAEQGDNTDWKAFELGAEGNVRVRLWWDDPSIEAHLFLHNDRAKKLADIAHEAGVRYDELGPISLGAGLYYLKVEATDGASVYTLEVLTDSGQGGAGSNRPGF